MNETARKKALSLLDKRDYSRKMLIDKLTDKGVTAEDAAEVVDRLCAVGVVDDARYAALVVRHYSGRGYGERRIREELYHRGIDRDLWDEALEEAGEPDSTVYGSFPPGSGDPFPRRIWNARAATSSDGVFPVRRSAALWRDMPRRMRNDNGT